MTAKYPQYAPEYKIQINGADLPSQVRTAVTSVRYEDGRQAADRVEVGIANPNLRLLKNHIRGLGFQPFPSGLSLGPVRVAEAAPAGTFDIDNKLTLAVGYAPGPLEQMFEGEITGVTVNFPNGGMPAMTVVAHDYMNRLQRGKFARGFGFLPDAMIAAILSAENLLIPAIDPAIIAGSTAIAAVNFIFGGTGRKQRGQSDFELLQEIAATYDADFWVDGNTLYLSRFLKEYTPRLTMTWGQNLLDFSPKVSTIGQVAGVGMRFVLREIPLDFLVAVGYDFDRESIIISVVPGAAAATTESLLGSVLEIIDQPIASPADLTNSALVIAHELREKLNNRLTGTGSCVGDPRIRAGAMIRLEGLGPDFSGNYRVASATHSIDGSGYRTNFEVKKEIIP
jgi:Bacteriophage probable baseplate hub protein